MPKFMVRQPNGKIALFSTVVDDFTVLDADTPEELLETNRFIYDPSVHEDDDEFGWTKCMTLRGIRWYEPDWVECTRMICDRLEAWQKEQSLDAMPEGCDDRPAQTSD